MKALRATLDNLSLNELKVSLRSLYEASVHKDLLAAIDTSLVLVEQTLINTASGEYRPLASADATTPVEALARCAAQLLEGHAQPAGILLLLPPADFVATRFELGVSGEKLLRSALQLQVHTLIPACEEPLLLGLNGNSGEGVALWFPALQAEKLFQAFGAEGLLLAAVLPRILVLPQLQPDASALILSDEDSSHLTRLEYRDGIVGTCLSIARRDLEQPDFAAQWQQETDRLAPAAVLHSGGLDFWTAQRRTFAGSPSYSFFPTGAEKVGQALQVRKQRRFGLLALAAVAVLLLLPFLNNSFQIRRLEASVEQLREESTEARQSQAAVLQMEEQWGPIAEYPQQDVGAVLLTLDELIDSSLTSFALNKGVVDIAGYAQDPALLLELLAEREEFFNVGQSRSSSAGDRTNRGDGFGIRFSTSGVDYAAYETKYLSPQ